MSVKNEWLKYLSNQTNFICDSQRDGYWKVCRKISQGVLVWLDLQSFNWGSCLPVDLDRSRNNS